MPTIGTVSRPAYVYDQETDTWVPVGVGPHTHDNFITSTTIDAKGDLLVGQSPDTVNRLGIGGNGTFLVADSTETLGMAWRNIITPATAATVPLTIRGAVSQSADLLNIQNSSSINLINVRSNGWMGIGINPTLAVLQVNSSSAITAGAPSIILSGDNNTERFQIRSGTPVFALSTHGGTVSSPTAVTLGAGLGFYQLGGYDGTNYQRASWITSTAEENWSGTNRGANLIFATTPIGSTTIAERMRIESDGRIKITAGGVLEAPLVQNAQTVDYTLVLADAGKLVECNKATQFNLTIPLNSSVPFPIGTQIQFLQTGAGSISFAGGGIALNGTPGTKTRTQWSSATLIKRGTDTWVVIGDLVP